MRRDHLVNTRRTKLGVSVGMKIHGENLCRPSGTQICSHCTQHSGFACMLGYDIPPQRGWFLDGSYDRCNPTLVVAHTLKSWDCEARSDTGEQAGSGRGNSRFLGAKAPRNDKNKPLERWPEGQLYLNQGLRRRPEGQLYQGRRYLRSSFSAAGEAVPLQGGFVGPRHG